MKSILIIGMGKFGHHLCENLIALGNDVMIVDSDEAKVADMIYKVTNVQIGDCTDPKVIKSLGIKNFDIVVVCIGGNFQSSLEITSLVKEMGAKRVISKADRDVHAKFLLKNGADEVIYPEKDIAERVAREYSQDSVFDYIELDEIHSIYETVVIPGWIGRSLRDVDVRKKYGINIIGIKTESGLSLNPSPDHVFTKDEHLMVIGEKDKVDGLLKKEKMN